VELGLSERERERGRVDAAYARFLRSLLRVTLRETERDKERAGEIIPSAERKISTANREYYKKLKKK
jgi:hypothetical protein